MKQTIATILISALLIFAGARQGRAEEAQVKPEPAGADVLFQAEAAKNPANANPTTTATQSAMGTELDKLGEEVCFLALTNFRPGGTPAPGAMGQAGWSATRTSSPALNKILTEFAGGTELGEGDKVTHVINEVVVGRDAPIGETVRLSDSYKDLKAALNDHTGTPMSDADLDDLVGLINGFLGPIKVHHTGFNFGPDDYYFKASFETQERKFRLNVIRHDGKYIWFVEDVI